VMRSGHGVSTQSALMQLVPDAASKVALALTVAVLCLLVVELLGARGAGIRRFSWTACLALAATPLLGLRSDVSNLIVLVPGLVIIAAVGFHRPSHGGWISLGLVGALFAGPWILASTASPASRAHIAGQIFLLLPLACLVGTYWTRWWFLRPAKTWLDEIRGFR
jgi:hypothetical protein